MKNIYERLDNLSPQKRRLLVKRLQEELLSAPMSPAVSPGMDTQLVAYLVCETEDDTTVGALREVLAKKLPTYMVPEAYVLLDALPLTPNGKVDREALPAPEHASLGQEQAYVAPCNDAEAALADIWTDILGVDLVGVYDNFFELGGHSLLVNKTIARMREAFEIELPLRALFEAPTIAECAVLIEEKLIAELAELPEEQAQIAAEQLE